MPAARCFAGCAGWSLPRDVQDRFGPGDSHLARYATRFVATEINSSFHRSHRPFVWQRWAASVPPGFRFSAKLPRTITHDRRLQDCEPLFEAFLAEATLLGEHLACLLVQLPPSLALEPRVAEGFFAMLRARWVGAVAAEPRHASWFTAEGDDLLARSRVARVLADPVRHPGAEWPGGWSGMRYLRLHGSPRMYYSAYDGGVLRQLARRVAREIAEGREVWCIFDNTAAGAAAANALDFQEALAADDAQT